MRSYFKQLYSNLLPIPCRLCGSHSTSYAVCIKCIADLPFLTDACPRCAQATPNSQLCGQCLSSPFDVDLSVSLFRYLAPIDRLIADFKYHDKLYLSALFADLMYEKLKGRTLPQCLIPIPLHPRRLRKRGYNQSLELAKSLSKLLSIPIHNQHLSRNRNTPPQASLPFKQRKDNIKHAFTLLDPQLPSHIALIDDVLTTGHTANAVASLLKKADVQTIEVWTIARTIRRG